MKEPTLGIDERRRIAEQFRAGARSRSSESPAPIVSPQTPPPETDSGAGLSEDLIAGELLRRKRARESLVEYARSIDIPSAPISENPEEEIFKPIETALARHHIVILEAIQETMETPNGRLMIFAPPGSAKSSYASVVAPSWAMAKWPGHRIILASYADKIAFKHSRKCRSVARQDRHIAIWPDKPRLSSDQRAVEQWALTNGSEFMAAGVMAGITGSRANGIMIDDPVKNREDADSEAVREKTRDEYQDSVDSRLLPNGYIIIIQTRWNEQDLSGGILPEDYKGESGKIVCRDGQTWTVLNIPAECERADDPVGRKPGEFLWPEWFPTTHWLLRKNNPQGQRTWAALFQQRPTAGEGIEFKRDWFKWYDPDLPPGMPSILGHAPGRPKLLTHYGGSDFATRKDKGDFTEHGIVGIDQQLNMWFLDWWFGQVTTNVWTASFISAVQNWAPRRWWHEGGPIGAAMQPNMYREMRDCKAYVLLEPLTSIENKTVKLASFQARAAAGTVWLPLKRAWATRLVDQLCAFPAGRHDDAADVCGLLGRGIDMMQAPFDARHVHKPGIKAFTEAWLMYDEKPEGRGVRYV